MFICMLLSKCISDHREDKKSKQLSRTLISLQKYLSFVALEFLELGSKYSISSNGFVLGKHVERIPAMWLDKWLKVQAASPENKI